MIRFKAICALTAALVLVRPAEAAVSKATIKAYVDNGYQALGVGGDAGLEGWDKALKAELKQRSPAQAALRLAPDWGLSDAQMREMIDLWIAYDALSSDYGAGEEAVARGEALAGRAKALAASTGGAPLALDLAGVLVLRADGCDAQTFRALTSASHDPVAAGWRLVSAGGSGSALPATCAAWREAFRDLAPDRSAALAYLLVMDESPLATTHLALLDWAASPEALSHVRAADRAGTTRVIAAQRLSAFSAAGLVSQALALLDGLSPDDRAGLLGPPVQVPIEVDGLPLALGSYGAKPEDRLDVADLYAIAGRMAEARALLDASGKAPAARAAFACESDVRRNLNNPRAKGCPGIPGQGADVVALDQLLNRSGEDPYPLAETYFSGGGPSDGASGALGEVLCRLFTEPAYAWVCAKARRSTLRQNAGGWRPDTDRIGELQALAAAVVPGWGERQAKAQAALDAQARAWSLAPEAADSRPDTGPDPSPFAEKPIPAGLNGSPTDGETAWRKSLAPLPGGFEPVRIERDGKRVVAITISQNLDPTGEVSQGGYWVHVSDDEGRTWAPPLYTGLSQLYPYVVAASSRVPLIRGDVIDLAVDVQELDTASITYPPIGLRSKRKQSGLYLTIPLADLRRDSDGDGVTDIVANHLLLDGKGGPPAARVGSGAASCTPQRLEDAKIMAVALENVFGHSSGALIQAIDRPTDDPLAGLADIRRDAASAERPIFLEGDPADFACLRTQRLAVVYTADQIARLRRKTPDFHAVRLGALTFNRAHDRGFISWDTGWSGGALRLTRSKDGWKIEHYQAWIS